MNIRLVLQLITPQVIAGMKIEDALLDAHMTGILNSENHSAVIRFIHSVTGGVEVDKFISSSKTKPSSEGRINFLSTLPLP